MPRTFALFVNLEFNFRYSQTLLHVFQLSLGFLCPFFRNLFVQHGYLEHFLTVKETGLRELEHLLGIGNLPLGCYDFGLEGSEFGLELRS